MGFRLTAHIEKAPDIIDEKNEKKKGIKRESVANKILPIKFGNSKQTKVFGEKNFIPHSK